VFLDQAQCLPDSASPLQQKKQSKGGAQCIQIAGFSWA
jgi:hypothetical protein